MLIKTNNKWEAIRAFINLWLKEKTLYCNWCGAVWNDSNTQVCCERPQIGTNWEHTREIIKQNRRRRQQAKNSYGSTDDKSMRVAISMPPKLLMDLEAYVKMTGNGKLFNNPAELISFMKEFKSFCVPAEV